MKNSFNHLWNGDHKIIKGKVFSLVIIQEYQISVYHEVQFKMAWHGFKFFLYFWGYESPRISSVRVGKKFKFALCNFPIHCHAPVPGSVLVRVKTSGNSSDFSLTPLPSSHSGQTENCSFSFSLKPTILVLLRDDVSSCSYRYILLGVVSLLLVTNTGILADMLPVEKRSRV